MERWPRLIRLFWGLRFVDDCVLVYPVYFIHFLQSGLTLVDISLMVAIWCGTVVLTEVPTGALADHVDRRLLIVSAMLCKTLAFSCWLAADGFLLFTVGFVFWGLHESLMSGTLQSLVWDALDCDGKSDQYATVAARAAFYSKLGTAIALVAGGFLAAYSMPLVLLGSVLMMLVGTALACGLREVRQGTTAARTRDYWASIRQAAQEVRRHPPLQRVLVFAMIGLVWANTEEFDQAYRELVGLPLYVFGLWNVLLIGGQAWAARLADRLTVPGRGHIKFAIVALAGMCLLAAALFPKLAMLPVYGLSLVVGAVIEVLVDADVQAAVRGDQRATVTSVNSLLMNLSSIAATLIVGGLSTLGGLPLGFGAIAVTVLLYSLLGWHWERSAERSSQYES